MSSIVLPLGNIILILPTLGIFIYGNFSIYNNSILLLVNLVVYLLPLGSISYLKIGDLLKIYEK